MVQARPRLNQMRGKAVPERMHACRFRYSSALFGLDEDIAYRCITHMRAVFLSFE